MAGSSLTVKTGGIGTTPSGLPLTADL